MHTWLLWLDCVKSTSLQTWYFPACANCKKSIVALLCKIEAKWDFFFICHICYIFTQRCFICSNVWEDAQFLQIISMQRADLHHSLICFWFVCVCVSVWRREVKALCLFYSIVPTNSIYCARFVKIRLLLTCETRRYCSEIFVSLQRFLTPSISTWWQIAVTYNMFCSMELKADL